MSIFKRKESHTVSYTAEGIHFTMEELRRIADEGHPDSSEVRVIAGREAGEKFYTGASGRYDRDRKSVIIVTLI